MPAMLQIIYALMLLIVCTVYETESANQRQHRKKVKGHHHEPASLASQQHHIIDKAVSPINLCSKERDMKLVCHCTPDDDTVKATKAECWIFRSDLKQHDPDWTAFHTQTQLHSLGFSVHGSGNLSFIPTTQIQSLRHLEKISIEFAQIHEVYSFAFGNFTRIKNISLPNNQIKIINAYAFANHPDLLELNLVRNDIYEIDPFAFINLPNLNRLTLEQNQINNIPEDTFEHLDKLNELLLSHNTIDLVTREMFKGLGNLWILKLSSNKLKFIGDAVFAELWSLIELDLDHNAIERLSERAFDGLNNLKHLNLENNRLKVLERGVFTGVPALNYLNLMKNSLETITFSNVLPLMDNLVNHTSVLAIKDNNFICDCRLSWIFDLKNRTKNFELKYSLEEIECMMKTKERQVTHKIKVNYDDEMKKQILSDETDTEYYDDEIYNEQKTSNLLQLKQKDLPCQKGFIEALEHPSTREFIGFDISWMHSSAIKTTTSIFVVLISQFAVTVAVYFL
ncbi:unnamed protein product [Diamesa serratosioi]